MQAPNCKALIIGGGFSGMAAAIQLRKTNIAVDLVELDKDWRSYGAGITISGPSLRALGELGVLDSIVELGWCADGCDMHTADGTFISQLPTPRIAGEHIPGGGAIMRPVLAKILAKATLGSGTQVRLGCTFTKIEQDGSKVQVSFTDHTRGEYDLVIGADGVFSKVRQTLFPTAPKPFYTGQGVWRAVVPRGEVPRSSMFLGKQSKTGVNPVSKDEMYLFLNDIRPQLTYVEDNQAVPMLKQLLEEFTAPLLKDAIASLGTNSKVIYRPLEGMLMPLPWATGNVLLIGDAVHATTPHLASGAGIGIEDGIVVAQELANASNVADALASFQSRRWERCRLVVESSMRLGEIEMSGGSKEEHGRVMREAMKTLLQPI
ncbi:FAD-dependent oxidoreductase [Pseudomonas sp. App30]|uniref:FAD-dependent oxidoreductase n=1 Tax=Pseudomonas sp. App30 TaxID=3068990 RepID=UPI003A8112D3